MATNSNSTTNNYKVTLRGGPLDGQLRHVAPSKTEVIHHCAFTQTTHYYEARVNDANKQVTNAEGYRIFFYNGVKFTTKKTM